MMSIPAILVLSAPMETSSVTHEPVIDLSESFLAAAARLTTSTEISKNSVTTAVGSDAVTDPARLDEIQEAIADYTLYVSLASALARKAVGSIETVVKAQ